jgi:putative ABC transport system permease protein
VRVPRFQCPVPRNGTPHTGHWAPHTSHSGVRVALGASAAQVAGHFVRRGLRLVAAGSAIGLVLALGAGQLLRGLVYGVSPSDPATLAALAAVMAAVALAASFVPARRARVDPVVALRAE